MRHSQTGILKTNKQKFIKMSRSFERLFETKGSTKSGSLPGVANPISASNQIRVHCLVTFTNSVSGSGFHFYLFSLWFQVIEYAAPLLHPFAPCVEGRCALTGGKRGRMKEYSQLITHAWQVRHGTMR